jgi:transposase-like protein
MTVFSSIPSELILEIKTFLSELEYLGFVNSSKAIFGVLKYETIHFTFNNISVRTLIKDEELQHRLFTRIKNPAEQVTLCTVYDGASNEKIIAMPSYGLITESRWGGFQLTPATMDVVNRRKFVALSGNDDLKSFEGIAETVSILKISGFNALSDISRLCHLKELLLEDIPLLSNVDSLAHLTKLQLINCPQVVTVSTFGNIHDLTLQACANLSNISGLQNNYFLMIKNCPNLLSFDAIKNATHLSTDLLKSYDSSKLLSFEPSRTRTLYLWKYQDTKVFIPTSCYRLTLENATKIADLSNISHLFELNLFNCPELKELKFVAKIPIVNIYSCAKLVDISGLSGNSIVSIDSCESIVNFSSLSKTKRKLFLRHCSGLKNSKEFSQVKQVVLEECDSVKELTHLNETVERLELVSLRALKSLNGLQNCTSLQHLEISHCPILVDFKVLVQRTYPTLILSDFHFHTVQRKFPNYLASYEIEQKGSDLFILHLKN